MVTAPSVAIIGAGIAGLAAALRLQDLLPDTALTLIERERRLGGKIVTVRTHGYVIEGGPDSFLAARPAGLALCRALGIEDRLQGTRPDRRGSFVMRAGRLLPIPEGLSGLVPARLGSLLASDLLTPAGKARVAREPDIPPRLDQGDESLLAFVERRFGREVYDRLIEALMSGIYAGSGEHLSVLATFPQLRALEREHGSVLAGLGRLPISPGTRGGFLTPRSGMGELVESAAARLRGIRIIRGHAVECLVRTSHGYSLRLGNGNHLEADGVIVATPAPVTACLLAEIDTDVAAAFAAVPTVSTASVVLGFTERRLPRPLLGYGYVTPRAEGRPVTACTWVSSKWAHRAPEGHALVRVFLGRAGMDEVAREPRAALIQLARDELREILGIMSAPDLARVTRWPRAMPQYTVGHADRMAGMRARLRAISGLAIAGNAIAGVGVPDCIRSGWEAADLVLAGIATDRPLPAEMDEAGGPDRI